MTDDGLHISKVSGSDEDLLRVKACFDENGSPKDLTLLRWQYAREGFPTDILCATGDYENEQRVAGIYAVFRSRFHVGDKLVEGCQSLDTMTDQHFRRRGLFKRLATGLYTRLENEGVQFVYGFPNGNSNPGFIKHLGWKNLDPVPYLVRPLRTSYLARAAKLGFDLPSLNLPTMPAGLGRKLAGINLTNTTTFSEAHERLWDTFRTDQGIVVALHRGADYLNWRYRDNPRFDYTTVEAVDAGGKLEGWVTFRVADKHGGRIAYIMELVHRTKRTGFALLNHALRASRKAGAELAIAWNFPHSRNHKLYLSSLFAPLPKKLWPIELHFGYRALHDCRELSKMTNWYISYSDSDTV